MTHSESWQAFIDELRAYVQEYHHSPNKHTRLLSQSGKAERYDELERRCTEAIELSPGGPVVALNIPIGQWHTVRALESGTVIMEVKDGPYEPTGEEDILAL